MTMKEIATLANVSVSTVYAVNTLMSRIEKSHPFHSFSMISCGHIAEMGTSTIYIVGAQEPGYARGMGLKARASFSEALEDEKRDSPAILALPQAFTTTSVHLCMKNPDQSTNGINLKEHPCCG